MADTNDSRRNQRRTVIACASIVIGMVGLAYASVPLYDLFCKVTGFNGTPIQRADNGSDVMERTIAVRLDANVAPGLNWTFAAETPEVKVKLGETTTIFYKVSNNGSQATTGIATYNVQPDLAGPYFSKLECFCYTEQTLQPGETLQSAVVFYVDPHLVEDADIADVSSITLSYTYFPSKGGKPVAAAPATIPIIR